MRTRDAPARIFDGALARDARGTTRAAAFDAAAVRDAALKALRRRDEDEHPGAKFVTSACKFLHDDLHPNCGASRVTYSGEPVSMASAGQVMTGLGYEMTGRTAVGAEYEHPEKDGVIRLLPQSAATTKDSAEVGTDGTSPDYGGGMDGNLGGAERDSSTSAGLPTEGAGE